MKSQSFGFGLRQSHPPRHEVLLRAEDREEVPHGRGEVGLQDERAHDGRGTVDTVVASRRNLHGSAEGSAGLGFQGVQRRFFQDPAEREGCLFGLPACPKRVEEVGSFANSRWAVIWLPCSKPILTSAVERLKDHNTQQLSPLGATMFRMETPSGSPENHLNMFKIK